MNRIKKIEDVIISSTEVLMEMIEEKRDSGIVLPDNSMAKDESNAHGIIIAVGAEVKDLEVGDIVLKTRTEKAPAYKLGEKVIILLSRYNIAVAVKPVNFDNSKASEITS